MVISKTFRVVLRVGPVTLRMSGEGGGGGGGGGGCIIEVNTAATA